MSATPIEWTDVTWNPVRGCARVSPGCEHCYAERTAHRFSGKGQPYEGLTALGKHGPRWSGTARFVPEMLAAPLGWKKPRRVFVNSMSDLFHDDVTDEQIAAVFGVMAACPQHTFQVLTKRPERMREWFGWMDSDHRDSNGSVGSWYPLAVEAGRYGIGCNETLRRAAASHPRHANRERDLYWPLPNAWLGVSCEDQQRANERIPLLLQTPAAVRFVSAEPLLGPLNLGHVSAGGMGRNALRVNDPGQGAWASERHLDWVIVGGESGPGARPCEVGWIRDIVRQCRDAAVPCFVKQLGAHVIQDGERRTKADRKGGDPSEWPHDLRAREFPCVGAEQGGSS